MQLRCCALFGWRDKASQVRWGGEVEGRQPMRIAKGPSSVRDASELFDPQRRIASEAALALGAGPDGSPLECLHERRCGGGPISVQASLPQVLDHSGKPAGVVVRFEPSCVRLWLHQALECDRCHWTPLLACPCSSRCCRLSSFIISLRTRKKGGLFGRPPFLNRSVGSSCLRRSCGRSSSTPRRPQPSVFPPPPSPGSSAPADRCRGYTCPRPLSDPTD
jgi:hypothetical protein